MPEVADRLPPPDHQIVVEIGHALSHLPFERIGEVLPPALTRIYAAAYAKGWRHEEALRHATEYGRAIMNVVGRHKLAAETASIQ